MELQLDKAAGIDLVHVQLMFAAMTNAILIKGGKIVPYSMSLPERSPTLPDVPAFADLGCPQMRPGGGACGSRPTSRPPPRAVCAARPSAQLTARKQLPAPLLSLDQVTKMRRIPTPSRGSRRPSHGHRRSREATPRRRAGEPGGLDEMGPAFARPPLG
jgi:hypothetical protein